MAGRQTLRMLYPTDPQGPISRIRTSPPDGATSFGTFTFTLVSG